MEAKLLIADDHPIFLKGLKEVIEDDPSFKVVVMASNGLEAWQKFETTKTDLVILDIDMPKMNGLEVAEKILQVNSEFPVIILTMHKEKNLFLKSLDMGILGYVLKENAVTDITNAITSVLNGNTYISPEMSAFLLKGKSMKKQETKNDKIALLTPSEKQILQLIGEYFSSKEIADKLFISEKTVFNHRMNICKKLDLTGKNSLLRFAIEHTA